MINKTMQVGDKNYMIKNNKLIWLKPDNDEPIPYIISDIIEVKARVRDTESGSWGRLVEWHDDDKQLHRHVLSDVNLQENSGDIRKILVNGGLSLSTDKRCKEALIEYLLHFPTKNRAIIINKLGWYDNVYVLPEQSFGKNENMNELVIYENTSSVKCAFEQKGSLDEWKTHVSSKALEQDCLIFSLSLAFAGQLLRLTNIQGGGFHIQGSSSTGKSTSQLMASSVWGEPNNYKKTWRTTDNALEGTAAMHNDGFLVLDEIGESQPSTIGKSIYMLANGEGKARMTKTTENRAPLEWQLLFLSSGEISLNTLLQSTGENIKAGQEVRFVQINANRKHGVFDKLIFAKNGQQQSEELKQSYTDYYGTAGIAWLEHITSDKEDTKDEALKYIDEFMNKLPSKMSGQAKRVAQRFALVASAGELASDADITGWKIGTATASCLVLFNEWLDSYGQKDIEEIRILKKVKAFIDQYSNSRFECVVADGIDSRYPLRINNRVGFKITSEDGIIIHYYFFDEAFENEVCNSLESKQVLKVLKANGCLHKTENSRLKTKTSTLVRRLGGDDRMYAIDASKLSKCITEADNNSIPSDPDLMNDVDYYSSL